MILTGRLRSLFEVVVLILCLLILSFGVIAQGNAEFEPDDCPFDVPDNVECGYLIVPEDRTDSNSLDIYLAVAIIRAVGDALPDPIVYLEGGPGGSALSGIDAWYDTDYGTNRDVILIDQRGTGYSEPALFCEEGGDSEVEDALDCRDNLEAQGINLAAYTSAANAADIEDLRLALGYDQINLYSISYGTRLAMTIMRDFPDGVRSVVLDSPYPPSADAFNEDAINFYYGLTTLAADCAADSACNAAFPDLETFFIDLVERANDSPVSVDGEELYGADLIEQLYQNFYDTAIIPYLPAIIYDTAEGSIDALIAFEDTFFDDSSADDMGDNGSSEIDFDAMSDAEFDAFMLEELDFDTVDDLYDYLDGLSDDAYNDLLDEIEGDSVDADNGEESDGDFDYSDSSGMFNSVTCAEEMPFSSLDQQAVLMANVPPVLQEHFRAGFEASIEVCDAWGVPFSGPIEDEIVVSDIPTLILVGQYDVATPPGWAIQAAEGLSNGYVLEFPGAGHGVIDATPCAVAIGTAFFDDPDGAPDTTCLNEIGAPDFYVP